MFDVAKPILVFNTQTHHPLLEHFTGYIFQLFEYDASAPRELFFESMAAAIMFAKRAGIDLSWDEADRPEWVTALDYVNNHDSMWDHMPKELQDFRGLHMKKDKRFYAESESEDFSDTLAELENEPGILADSPTSVNLFDPVAEEVEDEYDES